MVVGCGASMVCVAVEITHFKRVSVRHKTPPPVVVGAAGCMVLWWQLMVFCWLHCGYSMCLIHGDGKCRDKTCRVF